MEPGMSQGLQLDLAAEAIAAAFVTQRGRAVLLKELTLLAPGLLIVTENLLRPSEDVPLGLVCFPLPPSGERPATPLQLTVHGRGVQLHFWSPKTVHQWLAAPARAQVPVLPPPHANATAASPAVHGNLALQGCQGCSAVRGRQLDSLADAVAQRIGDFATALVTAADAELTSLRATAACDAAAVEESDSSDVSSNGSCAGTHSAQHRRAATEAEAGATEAGTHAAAKAAAAVEAALDGGAAMHAESVPVSPFGRFAAGRASGLSPSSLGAALAEDSDASRRGSADDAGMLLFGDDNFAGLRRRNLSAALTASPRSRDRTPRPSASLPVSPLQPTAPEAPEPGSSNYASADGSGRRNSRSSGDSRLGLPAAVPAHSGSSPPQPLLHAVRKPSDLGGQGAGSGDLNSSRRLSLQTFLQSQLELLNSQQPANSAPGAARASPWQQSPQPPAQQPAAQHAAGDSAAAPERRQPSAASSLPVTAGAAAAEAAAAALESAASALRQGAAATAAAADALPPAGTVLQAGAAAGAAVGAVAALAATAPVVAPAATEAVTSAIGDAAAAVVNSAAQTASAAVGAAAGMASTACGEVAAAAAGTAAEGAAAATCAAAQTAADVAAAGPIAQTAADAACCAAETAAHAAVPAASALGVAMVGAAGPAAAGLAGLVLRQQSFGEAGDGAQAASGASDQAQPAAQRSAGQSANSSSSSLQQLAERDSLPLAGLRGGALSSSNGQELSTATDVSPGCDSDAACHSSQHATKLGRHTPFGGKAGDETACCGAAGTCCCKCWQALSSPWLAIRGSALERHFCGWQPSRRLQADAACCTAMLLACLGVCLAPWLLGGSLSQLLHYAVLVACLAAAPLLLMLAFLPWYLEHREILLSGTAAAVVAVFIGAATARLRAINDAAAMAA